jgi:hypothetical protein
LEHESEQDLRAQYQQAGFVERGFEFLSRSICRFPDCNDLAQIGFHGGVRPCHPLRWERGRYPVCLKSNAAPPTVRSRCSGTPEAPDRFPAMTVSLSQLLEESFQIAWEYLERTGELGDGMIASRFLSDTIEKMIRRGERSRLGLSNRAISAYQRSRVNGAAASKLDVRTSA